MHTDPDYSAACVVLETDAEDGLQRYGITFTLKKGTEVVVCAVNALAHHVLKKDLRDIVGNFRDFYRQLTSDGQLRWPLWKLLVDMTVGAADVAPSLEKSEDRWISHYLSDMVAGSMGRHLKGKDMDLLNHLQAQEGQMLTYGYPAYTTSCAWLRFKIKVGADLQDDICRCQLIRNIIGPKKTSMMDANQRWDVPEAVEWMSNLAEFKPLWIESQPPLMTFWDMLPSPGMCEYVNHLHEHFKYPVIIKNASYMPPQVAGYSTEMKAESVKKHRYPDGEVRKKLLAA